MEKKGLSREEAIQVLEVLSFRAFTDVQREERVAPDLTEEFEPSEIIPDEAGSEIHQLRPDERGRAENAKNQKLGSDPKSVRAEMRSTFAPGL